MTADPRSITHLYRDLLALRRSSAALHVGDLQLLDAPEGVLAYERTTDDGEETRAVVVNFTAASIPYEHTGQIALSSVATRIQGPFDGILGPDEAVVLRPS
jgi:alpha-glucosidase